MSTKRKIKTGETVGEPIQSSDTFLPAAEEYDPNGFCPFRRVPPEERPYRDARFELGFRKGELLKNIQWANWKSWDQTNPVEQAKAQSWLDAQRAELLKWHQRWAGKVDTDRLLREVFPIGGDRFNVAARDFAAKVLGF